MRTSATPAICVRALSRSPRASGSGNWLMLHPPLSRVRVIVVRNGSQLAPRLLGKLVQRQLVDPVSDGGNGDRLIEGVALLRYYLIAQHFTEEPIGRDDTGKFGQSERRRCRCRRFPKPFIDRGQILLGDLARCRQPTVGRG